MARMKYFTCAFRRVGRPLSGVNCWPVRMHCPGKKTAKKRYYIYDVRDCECCTNYKKKEIY